MDDLMVLDVLDDFAEVSAGPEAVADRPRATIRGRIGAAARKIGAAAEWAFGVVSLVLGLSILAALPIAQFLSLGYLLEASARVARTGRLRDGLVGVRRAARVGGAVAGVWVSMIPAWVAGSFARSAGLIDPGGPAERRWRIALGALTILTALHILKGFARGGRFRHFTWAVTAPFWLVRRIGKGGLYREMRDGLWDFTAGLRLPYLFRLGVVGFVGTLAWIAVPASLIAAGGRFPPLGIAGALLLALIVPFLPFLQVRYAVEGTLSALFSIRAVRDRFRRAPWAFAFALMVMLLAAIPLYLLKIEMIPRDAAWLPGLVFVGFLAPARLLAGWAYARSSRRERPRHWTFRILGRAAIVPAAMLYVLVVFLAQYTSWGGSASLFEQHAFLLPAPFLGL